MERFSGKREITISTWVWLRWTWKPKSSKASMIKPRWFASFVAEDTQPSVISIQARHTHLLSVTHPLFPHYLLLLVPCRCFRFFHRLSARHEREREKKTNWFKSLWWFFTYVSSRRLLGETEYFRYPCMPPTVQRVAVASCVTWEGGWRGRCRGGWGSERGWMKMWFEVWAVVGLGSSEMPTVRLMRVRPLLLRIHETH